LIGNAWGRTLGVGKMLVRGVFVKETRRKPLAFAGDAVRHGATESRLRVDHPLGGGGVVLQTVVDRRESQPDPHTVAS
jgi:hypothetical protein